MQTINQFNYLSIQLLEQMGNLAPSQSQIDLVENLLISSTIDVKLKFNRQLNGKELACLYWAAKGKSSGETATLLNLSQSTVELYRKEIKRKLNASNITHAVFEGIRFGHINTG